MAGRSSDRVANGDYSLEYKHQKYLQHKQGEKQYKQATNDRKKPQSYFTISEAEAQEIAWKYAGTGTCSVSKSGTVLSKEYYSVDREIGCYYSRKDGWVPTNRVMAVYSKDGCHIVPVKDND